MTEVPETISFAVDDGVGTVTIDRPPVNALSSTQYVEYAAFFEGLAAHDEVQAVVVESTGEGFVAGHDVNEFVDLDSEQARTMTDRARHFFRAVDDCAWPTIAAVDGYALGTGLALAAVTDIRHATADATFGLPEVDRGVLGGYKFAQRHLPEGHARELFFTGEPMTARVAHEAGFVQGVHDDREALHDAVSDLARTIADKDRTTIRLAKQSVTDTRDDATHEGYATECGYTVELRGHDSARASSASFFEE